MKSAEQIIRNEKEYWSHKTDYQWLSEKGIHSVLALMPPFQGDVLELCSGSGMFTKRVPRDYASYTCFDLSGPMLNTLKSALPHITVMEGNAEEPSLPSSRYDVVVVFAGLHHLTNIPKTLQHAHRLLRPGGRFVALEPNKDCWYRRFMLPLRPILNIYTEDEIFLSPGFLRNEMTSLDFQDVTVTYVTPDYNPAHLNPLNKVLALCMRMASSLSSGRLSQSFFIMTGRKKGTPSAGG